MQPRTLGTPIHKPLGQMEVSIEANRCLNCYDAPCTTACPTHIDVPSFIGKIATGNLRGSARVILDANPLGASCARVCPTDQLCEGACVYHDAGDSPIRIGDLQRYAVDYAMQRDLQLFEPGAATGKHVAIVGGGPAGIAAARDLRRYGHAVTIFEAKELLGGLNTFGIVPFRLDIDTAIWEANQVVRMGAEIRYGVRVGEERSFDDLLREFDAIVLACGMGGVPRLGIPGDEHVIDAIDFIEAAKLGRPLPHIGSHVAVIGAGNTAIDALTCSKRLGAERVTCYYRRGEAQMTAYGFEYEFAKQEGIEFRFFCAPRRVIARDGRVTGIEFARTALRPDGSLETISGSEFIEPVESVIAAIGQSRLLDTLAAAGIAHDRGVVRVDEHLQTTRPGVFAAGDCIFEKGSREAMVVEAAEQGKIAARAIDEYVKAPR